MQAAVSNRSAGEKRRVRRNWQTRSTQNPEPCWGAIVSSQSQPLRFFSDHLIANNYGRGFSNIVLSERTALDAKVRRRSKLQPVVRAGYRLFYWYGYRLHNSQAAGLRSDPRAPLVPRTTWGQQTFVVIIKRIGVVDHHLADGRGGFDMIGQFATEHRKQAVGMSDCGADRRRVGAVGDVELGGDQLDGEDYTGVAATWIVQYV